MRLSQLLQPWIDFDLPFDCEINGLQNDSRLIKDGDVFIAYPGAVCDGRDYIEQAFGAGARAILYDPDGGYNSLSLSIPMIALEHINEKLAAIASRFFEYPANKLFITGVTGTNGKTTVAYQLAQAHQLLGQNSAYIGTIGQGHINALQQLNNTTPDTLCLQKLLHGYSVDNVRHVCMEVSSHALSQKRVDEISFNQAIFTNLSHEHLDYHHTMDDYARVKATLFRSPGLQWAIVNNDDTFAPLMLNSVPPDSQILTYGIRQEADIKVTAWHMDMNASHMEVTSPWGKQTISINALGEFNLYNALAVFASLLAAGYPPEQITNIMPHLQAAPGRMEIVGREPLMIVDYAHTPAALENVLLTLNQLKEGRLWAVFGCGGDRDKAKRPVMGKIAGIHADQLIITSDNPRNEDPYRILDDIAAGIVNHVNVHKEVDRSKAIQQAINRADKNDIILIAGKGHENYQQVGDIKLPFSDQDVIRKLVRHSINFGQ